MAGESDEQKPESVPGGSQPQSPPSVPPWTGSQLQFIVMQPVSLVTLFVLLILYYPMYEMKLVTTGAGLELLIRGLVITAINVVLFLVLSFAINRVLLPGDDQRKPLRWTLLAIVGGLSLFFFFLPVLQILVLGPASIGNVGSLVTP